MIIIDRANDLVSSLGSGRRLQALVAIGHSPADLARRLRIQMLDLDALLRVKRAHVPLWTHRRIERLFIATWARPVQDRSGNAARTLARSEGWVGPLAWDDIDDPRARPNVRGPRRKRGEPIPIDELAVERAARGEPLKLTRAERLLVVPRLHARKWSDELIAQHLFVNERTILRDRRELGLESFDQRDIRKAKSA